MSDTAQLFILAGIWSLIAAYIVRFISKWPARTLAFALLVGIPFWELPYGYYNFQTVCKNDGMLHVFEPISPQKTICADYPFDSSAKSLLRFGFDGVEARTKTGEVILFSKDSSTPLSKNISKTIASEFCVTFENNHRLPWRMIRHDFLITRANKGTVVARHSVFDWAGTWWQAAEAPVFGRGGQCREDPIQPIVTTLLIGTKGVPTK